jgi:transcriptional regulator with XRE-family HTH domain
MRTNRALLAQAVRDKREAEGLTLSEASAASGVSRSTLNLIEREAYEPRTMTLGLVARWLGRDWNDFLLPIEEAPLSAQEA